MPRWQTLSESASDQPLPRAAAHQSGARGSDWEPGLASEGGGFLIRSLSDPREAKFYLLNMCLKKKFTSCKTQKLPKGTQ